MLSVTGEKPELLFPAPAFLKRHKLFYHLIGTTGILQILNDGIRIRIFILCQRLLFYCFQLLIVFWSDCFRRLRLKESPVADLQYLTFYMAAHLAGQIQAESPVADLQYLTFYMAAHLAGQIQAGIRLIHGVTLRTGEVNKFVIVYIYSVLSRELNIKYLSFIIFHS